MDTQFLSIPVYNHQVIFSIACSLQFYQSCKEPTPGFHQLQFTTTRWFYHKIVLSSFIYQLCTKQTPGFHRLQFSFTSHTRSRHRLSVCGKWTPFLFFCSCSQPHCTIFQLYQPVRSVSLQFTTTRIIYSRDCLCSFTNLVKMPSAFTLKIFLNFPYLP